MLVFRYFGFLFCGLSVFFTGSSFVYGYELVTHEYLSEQAANQSVIASTSELGNYGLNYSSSVLLAPNVAIDYRIPDLIGLGARLEDSKFRVVHHFFDPQRSSFINESEESIFDRNYGLNLSSRAPELSIRFAASPLWALGCDDSCRPKVKVAKGLRVSAGSKKISEALNGIP
tara:strand:+ start:781 stop:1299 length:519 start_codon:yes stop_codon:yes gene_type:complete